jgi:hypothetical protein
MKQMPSWLSVLLRFLIAHCVGSYVASIWTSEPWAWNVNPGHADFWELLAAPIEWPFMLLALTLYAVFMGFSAALNPNETMWQFLTSPPVRGVFYMWLLYLVPGLASWFLMSFIRSRRKGRSSGDTIHN